MAILATVIVNYGTKIRSNQEIFLPFFLVRSKYLKLKKISRRVIGTLRIVSIWFILVIDRSHEPTGTA